MGFRVQGFRVSGSVSIRSLSAMEAVGGLMSHSPPHLNPRTSWCQPGNQSSPILNLYPQHHRGLTSPKPKILSPITPRPGILIRSPKPKFCGVKPKSEEYRSGKPRGFWPQAPPWHQLQQRLLIKAQATEALMETWARGFGFWVFQVLGFRVFGVSGVRDCGILYWL